MNMLTVVPEEQIEIGERFNRALNRAFATPHPSLTTFAATVEALARGHVAVIAAIRDRRARGCPRESIQLPQPVELPVEEEISSGGEEDVDDGASSEGETDGTVSDDDDEAGNGGDDDMTDHTQLRPNKKLTGQVKRAVIDEEMRKKKSVVMAELGAYTGYSTVRSASLQSEVVGKESHYYSFKNAPVFAARLYFIDHEKTVNLSDLKMIIGSQTLAPSSVIAAESVVRLGAPDYLEFIENNPQFSTERHTISCGRDGLLLPDLSIATFLG
ncbi:hypothetical protein GN958_ATG17594 [Phytophthora infestans]|uniref:Uncharacterized protein n=1 Tax=Phytophthora infestans TaxID=4787 RepID=A0A8S9U4W0_PHYIN|nr:hypothetical protein GN958_ATG17594 [Phytophthora infestans]